jgi:pSer/pThr/pTyr-binding forkhead associated (FHA) protein
MSAATNENELTSTLHLGLRSVVEGSPDSALARFLKSATDEETAAYQSIVTSDIKAAMVFIHRGPSKGSRYLLSEGALRSSVSIGRSKDSDVFLDDVTVSRSHAKIFSTDSGIEITDLGSLNGTYVNNELLAGKKLISGDEIQIGKFHMLFISHEANKNTVKKEDK